MRSARWLGVERAFDEARVKPVINGGAAVFDHDQVIVGIGSFVPGRDHNPAGSEPNSARVSMPLAPKIISRSVTANAFTRSKPLGDTATGDFVP